MADTINTLCTDAALELNRIGAADALSGEDSTFLLKKLNRILDNWNADGQAVYTIGFTLFTLVPNLSPHTIGVAANSPTFTVTTNRPVNIQSASLVLTGSPAIDIPINIRDDDWWALNRVKGLATAIPTDLYYSPDWPNGSLYFWPVPTVAYGVRLEMRFVLAQVLAATPLSLPPGYRDALTLTLAEDCITAFGAQLSPLQAQTLMTKARQARARIFANNRPSPNLATRDSGLPGTSSGQSNWFYPTGSLT